VATTTDRALLRQLRGVTRQIYTQPELLAEWSTDASVTSTYAEIELKDLPSYAVVPETAGEVAEVVKIAAAAGRQTIVRGGGTNRVGALSPVRGAIVISTQGLNVIEAVNGANGTVRVDSGVTIHELEERLAEQGYTLGHLPRAVHHATVGGEIAIGSAGIFSTKYGAVGDMLVAIDAVLADGTVISSQVMPGHATGPHWPALYAGSESALGVITAATLMVRPIPERRAFRAFDMSSFFDAAVAVQQLIGKGVVPAAVRLHDERGSRACQDEWGAPDAKNLMLLVFEGPAALVEVEEALTAEAMTAIDGRDLGPEPAALWLDYLRAAGLDDGEDYDDDEDDEGLEGEETITGEIDVAAPWSVLPAVIAAGRSALSQLPLDYSVVIAHPRHTGAMVGFAISTRYGPGVEAVVTWRRAVELLIDAVSGAGGGASHHCGIGVERLHPTVLKLPAATGFFGRVLSALDPDERFPSPGLKQFR
jgi:alkyldihydroxyacetonephosphate synthase